MLIKERAEEYISHRDDVKYCEEQCRRAYIVGCNDQKKIDVNKACDYLANHVDKGLIFYDIDAWIAFDEFINAFRRAMEE